MKNIAILYAATFAVATSALAAETPANQNYKTYTNAKENNGKTSNPQDQHQKNNTKTPESGISLDVTSNGDVRLLQPIERQDYTVQLEPRNEDTL